MNENKTATMNLAIARIDVERVYLLYKRNNATDEAEYHDYDVMIQECERLLDLLGVER